MIGSVVFSLDVENEVHIYYYRIDTNGRLTLFRWNTTKLAIDFLPFNIHCITNVRFNSFFILIARLTNLNAVIKYNGCRLRMNLYLFVEGINIILIRNGISHISKVKNRQSTVLVGVYSVVWPPCCHLLQA